MIQSGIRSGGVRAIRRLVIHLIKPSKYDDDGYVIRHWRGVLPSNTLACLYGLTEDVRIRGALGPLEWRIELTDESVQKTPVQAILRAGRRRDTKVLVCLVGVQSNQFERASDLALQFRAEGVDVLIGGFHVSGSLSMLGDSSPEIRRLLAAGVTVVAGEVEGRWEGILRDALEGALRPLYNFLAELPDMRAAPLPRISRRYLRHFVSPNFGTLDCGRGCPFNCSFCTVINVQGRKMRERDPERLIDLIRENYRRDRISYYFFTDDNFCRNKHWEAILDGLIRLRAEEGIRIAFMVQVDVLAHKLPRFVEKAKAAGCSQVFIGLESLNPKNLEAAAKRQNRVEEYGALIAAYRGAGISTHLSYIIGFPFDTSESVREDVRRLREDLGPEQVSFFVLTPLPGSRDHLECVQRGVVLDPDLNRYDSFHVTVPHPHMTAQEWAHAYDEAWGSFYHMENMKAVLRRAPAEKYWGVFCNSLWYKNAILVERGHPMIHGFVRLKGRFQRRPGWPIETRRQYFRRRLGDGRRTLRLWARLAFEMEEVWLSTRPRNGLEQQVAREVERRCGSLLQWRDLRLRDLQRSYLRVTSRLKKSSLPLAAQWRASVPSLAGLWVKQRNLFDHSLTISRQHCQRVWRDARAHLLQGRLHRVDVGRAVSTLIQESCLFAVFLGSFLRRLAVRRFRRAAVEGAPES